MTATASTTWVLWITGVSVVSIGLALLVWAIVGDRSRGRKRCPSCWYDMSGAAGLMCPECGETARDERDLHRVRRSRRVIAGAGVMVIGGAVALTWPFVSGPSWTSNIPMWLLLRTTPVGSDGVGDTQAALAFELQHRLQSQKLSDPEVELLLARVFAAPSMPMRSLFLAREQWPVGEPVCCAIGMQNVVEPLASMLATQGLIADARVHGSSEWATYPSSNQSWNVRGGDLTVIELADGASAGPLQIDVRMRRGSSVVWEGTTTLRCDVKDSLDVVMPTVSGPEYDKAVQDHLRKVAAFRTPSGYQLMLMSTHPFGSDVALGCVIDVVASNGFHAVGVLAHHPSKFEGGRVLANVVAIAGTAPRGIGDWTIRVKGEQRLGLRCCSWRGALARPDEPNPTRCWVGEVELQRADPSPRYWP